MKHRPMLTILLMTGALLRSAQGQVTTHADSSLVYRIGTQMTAELNEVAKAQREYRHSNRHYASSAAALEADASRTIVLTAGPSGWSGVATDSVLPGFRCFYRTGDASAPVSGVETKDKPFCTGVPDTVIRYLPDVARVAVADEDLADPPQQRNCKPWIDRVTVGQAGRGGPGRRTKTQVIVDTTGTVEPTGIRIIEATDILVVMDHLYVLSNCGFTPGTVDGIPVRVLVQQQFNVE